MSADSTEDRMTLVTGSAGFIGFHVAKRLLERGERVLGVAFEMVCIGHRPT